MNDVPGLIVHSYAYFSIPLCLDQTEELRETMDDETVSGVVGSQAQRWDLSTWTVRGSFSRSYYMTMDLVSNSFWCRRRRRPNVQTKINYVERLCKKGKGCMRLICRIWTHTDIWILIVRNPDCRYISSAYLLCTAQVKAIKSFCIIRMASDKQATQTLEDVSY